MEDGLSDVYKMQQPDSDLRDFGHHVLSAEEAQEATIGGVDEGGSLAAAAAYRMSS